MIYFRKHPAEVDACQVNNAIVGQKETPAAFVHGGSSASIGMSSRIPDINRKLTRISSQSSKGHPFQNN